MDLAGAQAELAARGFDYLSSGRMTLMLNNAKNTFEDAWPFPWLWKTVTATAPLTIADLKYIAIVKDDANQELLGIDLRMLEQDSTDLDLPGTPVYWWLQGGSDPETILHVWPVATTTLNVTYVAESDELALATDTPLIPGRYHTTWIDLAVISAYQDSDNFQAASALRADVTARLNQIIERYETRNRQNSGYIAVRSPSLDD